MKSKRKFLEGLFLKFRWWGIDFGGVGSALDQFWNSVERHDRYVFLPLGPFPRRPLWFSRNLIQKLGMFPRCMSISVAPIDCFRLGMFAGRIYGCNVFSWWLCSCMYVQIYVIINYVFSKLYDKWVYREVLPWFLITGWSIKMACQIPV